MRQGARRLNALGAAAIWWTAICLFSAVADESKDFSGWEKEGAYNQLYNLIERDQIKGTVKKVIDITPLPGMSPGAGLIVEDREGDDVVVHVGPKWFLTEKIGLKKGDKVKIRGVWAVIDDEDIFIASKIKMGDFFELKVRLTKDGTPFWTMTEAELANEKASQ